MVQIYWNLKRYQKKLFPGFSVGMWGMAANVGMDDVLPSPVIS